MKTGMDVLEARARERGITLPDSIPAEMFAELGLPLVVQCRNCTMTMALPSAVLDDENFTYCADCAGVVDPDDPPRYADEPDEPDDPDYADPDFRDA